MMAYRCYSYFQIKTVLSESHFRYRSLLLGLKHLNTRHFKLYSTGKTNDNSTTDQIPQFISKGTFQENVNNISIEKKSNLEADEHEVSDWVREIQKLDDRPPITYRRQNYPGPVSRTVGILTDDLKIFFSNIFYAIKQTYRLLKGDVHINEEFQDAQNKLQSVMANDSMQDNLKSCAPSKSLPKTDTQLQEARDGNISKLSNQKKQSTVSKFISKITPKNQKVIWPSQCDILIIGGGAIGSSIAYHVKKGATDGISVVVIEKDSTYQTSSTVLSVGGIRQQFSLPENILLSQYGMEFLRDSPRLLEVEGVMPPPVNFQPHGYLTLASEQGLQQLQDNLYVQQHFKACVKFLEPSELKKRFPWLNTDGIAGGVLGLENEGWFDPWSLLMALRCKAINLGVQYVEAEMKGMSLLEPTNDTFTDGHPSNSERRLGPVTVCLPDGEERTIEAAAVVLATGHSTGKICYDMLGIGKAKEGLMAYPVPIEPRKRYVYCFHAPKGPGLATPLVIDPTGAYFRREGFGNMFLGGMSPVEDEEPLCDNLEVDHDFFMERVWPALANRVPAFEELKVQGSWAGFYEYNVFDQNGIIGTHPIVCNLLLAAGFSGHGIQHSLGVGRAVKELLLNSAFKTLDLSRFDFERVYLDEPMYESGIV